MTQEQFLAAVAMNTKRPDKADVAQLGIDLALERITARISLSAIHSSIEVDVNPGSNFALIPKGAVRGASFRSTVLDATAYPLDIRPIEWMKRMYPTPDAIPASRPEFAYIANGGIKFVPGSLDGGILTVELSPVWSSESIFLYPQPVGLMECVISFATSWVFKSVQLFQEAAVWENNFNNALGSLIMGDALNTGERFQADTGCVNSAVDPVYDPFAGHSRNWWNR